MNQAAQDYDIRGKIRLGSLRYDRQYTAVNAVLRRLYMLDEPGVILADEVGMGKTYVAFGVAAWLLQQNARSRILVLTNSKQMMGTWRERWEQIEFIQGRHPSPSMAWSWQDYRDMRRSDHLVISSYDTLKKFHNDDEAGIRASMAEWLFRPCHHPGRRLRVDEVNDLKRKLGVDLRRRSLPLDREISVDRGKEFWRKYFDWTERSWGDPDEAAEALDELEISFGDRPQKFDLVIVDEAHRLEAKGRQAAMRLLLHGKTDKILYVTATPFALSVSQLKSLLGCFHFCNGTDRKELNRKIDELRLEDFERAVASRQEYPALQALESQLRRWVVRRTWKESTNGMRRRCDPWKVLPDLNSGFLSTVALERAISEMLRELERTHIASRRVSLCSSWAAARQSLEDNPIGDSNSSARRWAELAARVLRRSASQDSPKLQYAATRITKLGPIPKPCLAANNRVVN